MKKEFKLNAPLYNYTAGTIITLDCDDEGVPLDMYWFRRFIDAKIDNCIEPIKVTKAKDK